MKRKKMEAETNGYAARPNCATFDSRLEDRALDYLSDAELLSRILQISAGPEDSSGIARKLLDRCGSLSRLGDLAVAELKSLPGMGEGGADAIRNTLALSRRLQGISSASRPCMSDPQAVAERMQPVLAHLEQEEFHVLLLGTKNQLIKDCMITRGLVNATLTHAREIFRAAVKEACVGIVLVHNHPSGDPAPSQQDISVTRSLVDAGRIMGIEVLDHVIIGSVADGRCQYWSSMKVSGIIK